MPDLEEEYNNLPADIRMDHSKEKLIQRLARVDRNQPIGRHGPLCLRKPTCSPDCSGGDC